MDLHIRKLALQCIYIQVIKESETIFSHVRMIGFVNQSPLNSLIHRKYSCLLHIVSFISAEAEHKFYFITLFRVFFVFQLIVYFYECMIVRTVYVKVI